MALSDVDRDILYYTHLTMVICILLYIMATLIMSDKGFYSFQAYVANIFSVRLWTQLVKFSMSFYLIKSFDPNYKISLSIFCVYYTYQIIYLYYMDNFEEFIPSQNNLENIMDKISIIIHITLELAFYAYLMHIFFYYTL